MGKGLAGLAGAFWCSRYQASRSSRPMVWLGGRRRAANVCMGKRIGDLAAEVNCLRRLFESGFSNTAEKVLTRIAICIAVGIALMLVSNAERSHHRGIK